MLKNLFLALIILSLLIPKMFDGSDAISEPVIKFDKESYSLHSRVNISIFAPSENVNQMSVDEIDVDIRTGNASLIGYRLLESDSDSGNFTGYVTLTGPDGISGGIGPIEVKMKVDRGDELRVSFSSRTGQEATASTDINYHIGSVFFDKKFFHAREPIRLTVIDEDLNIDPEKPHIFEILLTSTLTRGSSIVTLHESGPDTGIFSTDITARVRDESGYPLQLNANGESIVAMYRDITLPEPYKPYNLIRQGNVTDEVWVFAIAHFVGPTTSSSVQPAPLFYGDQNNIALVKFNVRLKTESVVHDLKFLKFDKKLEFVNVADREGKLELQIPREAFHDIASVSINHMNSDFALKKNATYFNIQISYPEGASKIEIFDLDTETPIVFRDPGLVDQQGNDLRDVRVGSQVMIQSEITNSQTKKQPFAYIVQIKNEDGVTVSLSWLNGELPMQDSFRAAQSWMPEESGEYTIETFLWNNLETPSPLAPSKNIEVRIIA